VKQFTTILLTLLLSGLLLSGCQNETPQPAQKAPEVPAPAAQAAAPAPQAMGKSGTVLETMDAAGYTYVQIDTGSEKFWAAAPKVAVKIGDSVIVPQGMVMKDYHSKTLDRDFSEVYFVDSLMVGGASAALSEQPTMPEGHPDVKEAAKTAAVDVDFSGLQTAEGGQTVEQIFTQAADLTGKPVKVRGKVVKYNADIMGKNWLHIQDGSGSDGSNDLTVTTSATAKVGDTVVVSGLLSTDKDFGYGYKYNVLLEDAEVAAE